MIEMTLHAVTVRCETLTQALVLLDSWAEMGRITLPPVPPAQVAPDGNVAAAAANVTSALEDLERKTAPKSAPAKKACAAPSPRPPRERRCRKCQRLFADKTCAKDCPACRPSNPKKAPPAKAAAPAAPAKKPATTKASAPARPPVTKRQPDVAAAKGLLGRAPIKPNEATKPCSSCGDKTRVPELDAKGRCRDGRPIGEPA